MKTLLLGLSVLVSFSLYATPENNRLFKEEQGFELSGEYRKGFPQIKNNMFEILLGKRDYSLVTDNEYCFPRRTSIKIERDIMNKKMYSINLPGLGHTTVFTKDINARERKIGGGGVPGHKTVSTVKVIAKKHSITVYDRFYNWGLLVNSLRSQTAIEFTPTSNGFTYLRKTTIGGDIYSRYNDIECEYQLTENNKTQCDILTRYIDREEDELSLLEERLDSEKQQSINNYNAQAKIVVKLKEEFENRCSHL